MSLRIVALADRPDVIETLAAWHHAQWGDLNPQRTLEDRIERLRGHLGDDDIPATFVGFENETLLGSASIVRCDLQQRADLTPWLASVYVAPQFRGGGIGNALVQCVEDHARSLDVERLYLFTPDRQAFYARRGWARMGEDELAGRRIVLMSLKL